MYEFIQWVAEVIYEGEITNQWYYEMIGDYNSLAGFLAVFGKDLVEIFG